MQIRRLREEANLSQQQLAAAMGTTQTGVSNWETGVSLPRARDLPRLASVLGCSIDALFRADEEAENHAEAAEG